MKLKLFALLLLLVLTLQLTSAIVVNSVDVPPIAPGEEGRIDIEVKNIFSDDAKDVSLILNFQNLPFIPIGTSEQSVSQIKEDDEEDFYFTIRAATEITPGDYEIPYTLTYTLNSNERTRSGTIGVKVAANPDLVFSIDTTNPILNQQGKISLKIINKGFFDARFVSVRILPDAFTLLSNGEDYIGTVSSDDFETANFDVVFKGTRSHLIAIVTYRDFDNIEITKNIDLPIEVYTQQKAIELGLIQKSKMITYIISAVVLILIFLVWRWWRKRRRAKKNQRRE